MKKYNLIDKNNCFYMNDNLNNKTYFTTEYEIWCKADILLLSMLKDWKNKLNKKDYTILEKIENNNIDIENLESSYYILNMANIKFNEYRFISFTY